MRRKSAARLAAVQALYQIELGDVTPDAALRDFLQHGIAATLPHTIGDEDEGREIEMALVEPDSALFTAVVRGALERHEDLDRLIGGALNKDWTPDRLEAVLRAILRAAAFELMSRSDIPPKVTISEFVDIAHAFYSGPEPGLVNAVLDRIARVLRAEDLSRDNDPAPR